MRHIVWVIKTRIWDTLQVIFYYVILYPVIGMLKIQNWIAVNHPCDVDAERDSVWDRIFMTLDRVTKPATAFEYTLNYNGLIHTIEL